MTGNSSGLRIARMALAVRPLRALGAVLGDLADLRYDTRWIGLPASAIGAPHPRFRIFILARRALSNPAGLGLVTRWRDAGSGECPSRDDRAQPSGHRPRTRARTASTGEGGRVDRGLLRRWGRYAAAIARWERITGRAAPAPAIRTKRPVPAPLRYSWNGSWDSPRAGSLAQQSA
jgi:DNA (cytosine-5)-methyltransferase 1